MSKNVIKKKPAKPVSKAGVKASKPSKSKPAKPASKSGKAKPVKVAVKSKTKKALKPSKSVQKTGGKGVAKKVAKKVVAKKIVKKAIKKIIKKVNPKKITAKPANKIVKKVAAKKPVAKVVKKPLKAVSKAVKKILPVKAAKIVQPLKPVKAVQVEKPLKNIKEVEKTKLVKSTLLVKVESPKSPKPEKVRKSKKAKKSKDDDDEPVIGNDPLIEEIIKSTKRKSTPKQPKILKTFVNPMASLAVAPSLDNGKKTAPKKEPKGKFELEYVVRTSAGILYEFLTTPSGLSEWFADDVNIRDGIFTFYWDGSEQKARLLNFKDDKYVKMQWVDKPEGSYFEFRIDKDELTGDISLIIIDFADEGSDLDTSKRLWDSQVNKLLHVIGSY
jgi:uncharacterized protein YndB with AHSA1/START domain